eukprot:8552152-Pyramimonas_sp.AAC.1
MTTALGTWSKRVVLEPSIVGSTLPLLHTTGSLHLLIRTIFRLPPLTNPRPPKTCLAGEAGAQHGMHPQTWARRRSLSPR